MSDEAANCFTIKAVKPHEARLRQGVRQDRSGLVEFYRIEEGSHSLLVRRHRFRAHKWGTRVPTVFYTSNAT
jgi:hypothetical protein